MWPVAYGVIQTSVHAGGMTRASMRARSAASIGPPSGPRYANPRPARTRVMPGAFGLLRRRRTTTTTLGLGPRKRKGARCRSSEPLPNPKGLLQDLGHLAGAHGAATLTDGEAEAL